MVARDVADGLISAATAQRDFGVNLACIWRGGGGRWRGDSLHELRNSLATAENITKVFERLVDIAFWVAMIVLLFFLLGNRCRARHRCRASLPACLLGCCRCSA